MTKNSLLQTRTTESSLPGSSCLLNRSTAPDRGYTTESWRMPDVATDPDFAAPWQADQEWANALTHAIAALGTLVLGTYLVVSAGQVSSMLAIGCAAYTASVFGTFLCSTLSHTFPPSRLLNRCRAWDQGMIYLMIAGTYTPIAIRFAPDWMRTPLLLGLWLAAGTGFASKALLQFRVNAAGTVSYLILGWVPAVLLVSHVPAVIVYWMLAGGVLYSIGIALLMNDDKMRYLHVGWHLMVMAAASAHYWTILRHVVDLAGLN